jgi:hypothetical protein
MLNFVIQHARKEIRKSGHGIKFNVFQTMVAY